MKIPPFSVFHAERISLFGDLHTVMTVGKDSSVFWTLLCLCPTPCCVRILLHWWRKKLICEDLFSITEPKFSFLKNIQACLDSGFGSLQSWSTETPWKLIWPCALSPSQLCKAHYSVPNLHLFSHSRGSKDAQFPFLSRTGRVFSWQKQDTSPQRDV